MADGSESGAILVLEDDPGTSRLLQIRLARLGYAVTSAGTPDAALALIRAGGVDLIILDYNLRGEVNGLEVHSRVQALGLDIPAILITGFADQEKVIEAIRAGVRDFVPKTDAFLDDLPVAVGRVMAQVRVRRLAAESDAIKRANDELKGLIAERERLQAELLESNRRLVEADRRKDEFITILAHELRNPLSAISNCVKILGNEPSDDEQAWCRSVIGRQTGQLGRLIDDLLDVSRITNGKIVLRFDRVDLVEVAVRAADSARFLIDSREHALTLDLPADPLILEADATRLEQVFVNLLTNAAKYTERGGRIGLSARAEGTEVVVEVADNGLGIAPEMLPRIFEMFTQVDHTHVRAEGGLGIGLTLVRRLVEKHGGRIEARSAGLGRGTTFSIRLPLPSHALAVEPATATPPPQSAPEPLGLAGPLSPIPTSNTNANPRPARSQPGGEGALPVRILVVDDHPDTTWGLSRLLGRMGYEVQVAGDGPSALELADGFAPDVVLLDIGLPRMDGYQVARAFRDRPGGEALLLVAVSGFAAGVDQARSRQAGFDYHLIKPLDVDQLLELVRARQPSGA